MTLRAVPPSERAAAAVRNSAVSFTEAFWVWFKIGWLSFGGPAGQIALMHRMLVDEKRWIGEQRFLHALNYCMLLPGPEAQQLAVYVGWLLHRTWGGLVAGLLFVLPGALVMWVLSVFYAEFHALGSVQALFLGIKAAVLAVVVQAVLRIGRRTLTNRVMVAIAAGAFGGIFLFALPFPLIILMAAGFGLAGQMMGLAAFHAGGLDRQAAHGSAPDTPSSAAGPVAVIDDQLDGEHDRAQRPTLTRALRVAGVCGVLWFAPVIALALWLGPRHIYVEQSLFFSKMAVVTFGGAYAVLAYVAQQAVDHYGWLRPGEMLDGLGLAETTPGPLIMVVQFVGFLAAYRNPGTLDPLLAGSLGALLTTWVTFVPCFLWVFLGAPYIEALRGNRALNAALSSITAAVVGVVLNLAVWFALHVAFADMRRFEQFGLSLQLPVFSSVQPVALLLSMAALVAMLRFNVGMLWTLAGCGCASVLFWLV